MARSVAITDVATSPKSKEIDKPACNTQPAPKAKAPKIIPGKRKNPHTHLEP